MHYEINVSLNGRHLFATHERSCRSIEEVKRVLEEVTKRFPVGEGFAITIHRYENAGKMVDANVILKPKGTRAKAI
jgi:hypothetical protein